MYSDKTSSYEKLSSTDRSVRIRKIPSESKLENTLKRNIRKPQIFATEIFKVIEDLATTNFNEIFQNKVAKRRLSGICLIVEAKFGDSLKGYIFLSINVLVPKNFL